MPDMSPEEMAAMQEQGGGAPDVGAATKLAQRVGDGLAKLSEMLNKSPAATDADREKMAMVMNGFIELVESNLGSQGPGQDAPPEELPADQGAVPAMGGMKGVPMGPQGRM